MTHISTPTILKEETILIVVIEPTSFKYITQIHFSDYKLVDALHKFDANSNGELINFAFEDRFGKLKFSSFPNLILLNLSNSELHGNIPPQIGDLSTLKYLNLSHCWLHGELPPLGTLSQLEFLDISDNLINGSIPPQLGNLKNHASIETGGYESVYKTRLPSGKVVSLKKLHCLEAGNPTFDKSVKNKIKFLTEIWHQNIVKLLGFCQHRRSMLHGER
ncbi:hypothetical protein Golob_014442 [Gossypium lobatum]|uniref:non-specific serine/threonine protein kinase n=1 Tax=Gossypium lobatum TaxID=34289 RepID=A0A7J8LY28_9ROSI|nr:hypothetical protein [Gossypium lobatum]